jgi:2-aminomuconate deaminase
MINTIINSPDAPEPVGAYPHARRVGDLLFLSGIGPRRVGSTEIPGVTLGADGSVAQYDIAVQTRSVFENVTAVLKSAGLGLEHLADVTVFLTNMKADFSTYNTIYAEYLSTYKPCRTTVEILSLPTPIGIELKCIAVFPDAKNLQ